MERLNASIETTTEDQVSVVINAGPDCVLMANRIHELMLAALGRIGEDGHLHKAKFEVGKRYTLILADAR